MANEISPEMLATMEKQYAATSPGFNFDQHFRDNYNTQLSPEQEAQFSLWAAQNPRLGSTEDYDARGFWQAGGQSAANGHGSDKWKKPNHPTFSDQSIDNGMESPWGGVYEGGKWAEDGSSYTPTAAMLKTTHPLNFLQRYMREREPGVQLQMDAGQ